MMARWPRIRGRRAGARIRLFMRLRRLLGIGEKAADPRIAVNPALAILLPLEILAWFVHVALLSRGKVADRAQGSTDPGKSRGKQRIDLRENMARPTGLEPVLPP